MRHVMIFSLLVICVTGCFQSDIVSQNATTDSIIKWEESKVDTFIWKYNMECLHLNFENPSDSTQFLDSALYHIKKILKLQPDNKKYRLREIMTYYYKGDYEKSLQMFRSDTSLATLTNICGLPLYTIYMNHLEAAHVQKSNKSLSNQFLQRNIDITKRYLEANEKALHNCLSNPNWQESLRYPEALVLHTYIKYLAYTDLTKAQMCIDNLKKAYPMQTESIWNFYEGAMKIPFFQPPIL